ncbi:MAG: hypothetical protein IH994_09600 [Proteobacteria bacterium]|nr:hypothetical protein [Pseudomonadota bacterium]
MNGVMEILRPATAAFALILIVATAPAHAQDAVPIGNFGDWETYKESEGGKAVCYMGSQPKKAKGKYKKRGETYILVTHRPAEKSLDVISIKAGYTYQSGSEVDVVIGGATFKMFTDAGHAFAYDSKTDGAIVKAMIRGARMIVKGTSSRGTLTTDTYSLKGFTAAYKAINKACEVKAK